ncbi:uncharacterized protein K452DRAFT_298274 [Aplosporella prunicola CBS 121167]|uniref:Transcription factor domain-containing protein n=1 Tax=Aplosporella prunicola CBS 121167 TaxID=1176127 RepID=A0A6A6BC03_9PEZI|nr:uncharacterized protein K452DRAFT_298274 [Aplosporella prunicola CBS 121167]KAF2141566.1 hypothetical protein K452DRAFT_298274 [Aplosporella prunicola CBS 121167]
MSSAPVNPATGPSSSARRDSYTPSTSSSQGSQPTSTSSPSSSESSSASPPQQQPLPVRPSKPPKQQSRDPFVFVNIEGGQKTQYPPWRDLRSHVQLAVHENKRRKRDKALGLPPAAREKDNDKGGNAREDERREQERRRARQRVGQQHHQVAMLPPRGATVWSVGAGRADPFAALPVENSVYLDQMIKYFFAHYPGATPLADDNLVNSGNERLRSRLNWNNTLWNLLRQEETSLLVLLYGISFVRDIVSKTEISRESLSYMGRTMAAVRANMPPAGAEASRGPESITESFVAAVAGLGAGTSIAGDFSASNSHIKGMHALIAARGGIDTFTKFGQRTLLWCELNGCVAQLKMPILRPKPLPINLGFPLGFERAVQKLHAATLTHLPSLAETPVGTALYRIHMVGLALAPPWNTIVDREAISCVLDVAEYDLLGELVRLNNSSEWAAYAFAHCEDEASFPSASADTARTAPPAPDPADLVYAAVAQAAQLYIWGVLSDVRIDSAAKGMFTRQLRALLSVPDLLQRWLDAGAGLPALAWMLGVGWSVARKHRRGEALTAWYEALLGSVASTVWDMLGSVDRLMAEFPYSDEFWKEMWRLANRWGALDGGAGGGADGGAGGGAV